MSRVIRTSWTRCKGGSMKFISRWLNLTFNLSSIVFIRIWTCGLKGIKTSRLISLWRWSWFYRSSSSPLSEPAQLWVFVLSWFFWFCILFFSNFHVEHVWTCCWMTWGLWHAAKRHICLNLISWWDETATLRWDHEFVFFLRSLTEGFIISSTGNRSLLNLSFHCWNIDPHCPSWAG